MIQYEPKIDQFSIEIDEIRDSVPTQYAKHSFPFSKGVVAEYLGEGGYTCSFTTFWMNEQYYRHKAFLKHIRSGNSVIFVHPIYGAMNGIVETPGILHNDGVRYCEISVTFTEELLSMNPVPLLMPLDFIPDAGVRALKGGIPSLKEKLSVFDRMSAVLSIPLDPVSPIMAQVGKVTGGVRKVLAGADSALNKLDAVGGLLELPAESFTSIIDFGTEIPGRIIGTVTGVVEKYVNAVRVTAASPSAFVNSARTAVAQLKATVRTGSDIDSMIESAIDGASAVVIASKVGDIYRTDSENQEQFRAQLERETRSADGTLISSQEITKVVSVQELDRSLFLIRSILDEELQKDRKNLKSMKEIADHLTQYVISVRSGAKELQTVSTKGLSVPLHILCRDYGFPYQYADLVMKMNEIENPTFCNGEVLL